MAYHTTIFRQLLSLFSRLDFQNIVKKHQGDFRVRTLTCWDQFIHLLFAHLADRQSLRDTVDSSLSQHKKLYHLGCRTVSRSTLSDANNKRDYRIYQDLFFHLLEKVVKIAPKYKINLPRKLYIMDATTIDLCLKMFPWARFRKNKAGVKIHTLMQADGSLPTFIHVTEAQVHDNKASKNLSIPAGSYLVFDKAYHDFSQYKRYKSNKIRFITRMKTNAAYKVIKQTKVTDQGVITDEMVEFTGFYVRKYYPHPLRRIVYWDQLSQRELVFLTNDFSLPAITIADIYRARWEIELFFKTIKQNLRIKRFLGYSKNAVLIQIYIAMIAYLLISYLKFLQKLSYSIQKIFRIIQINLFERKCIIALLNNKVETLSSGMQISLFKT